MELTINPEIPRSARPRQARLTFLVAACLVYVFSATPKPSAAEGVVPLEIDQSVDIELLPGAARSLTLSMTEGEYFQIGFSPSPLLKATVELRDPAGRIDQTSEIEAPQVLCGIAQSTGDHSLFIRLSSGDGGSSAKIEVAREVGRTNRPGDADLCRGERAFWQGRAEENKGEIAPALASYDRALAAFRQAGDLTGQVKALFRAGRVMNSRRAPGDVESARSKFDQALPLADRLASAAVTDRAAAGSCASLWSNVGLLLRAKGDAQGAQALYSRAVAVARAWPNDLDLADRLRNLGDVSMQSGDRATAKASYLEAISLAAQNPARFALAARAQIGIGQLADRLEEALAHFDVARLLAPDQPEVASLARHERCVALSRFGAFGEALAECQASLVLACQAEDAGAAEAAGLNTLGSLYVDLGSYDKAIEQFERANQLFRGVGAQRDAGGTLLNQGVAQLALNRFEAATQSFEHALAIAREADDPESESSALMQLGRLELQRPEGNPTRARERLIDALALAARSNAPALLADTRLALASADALLGNSQGALTQLATALALAESLGDPVRRASVLTRRAEVLYSLNDLDAALASIDQAAELIDDLRTQATSGLRASFLARRRRTFELRIEILMRLEESKPGAGYDIRAFQASESARARSLLDLLAERRSGGPGTGTAEALSAEQIRSALAPGELLIEYFRTGRATFLFAVTRDTLAAFRLDSQTIDGALRSFTAALANPQSLAQGIHPRAGTLYRALLGPVSDLLAGANRLIVVADGDLYDLPFETLVPPAAPGTKASYLVETRTISYVPSASILPRLAKLPLGDGPEFLGFAVGDAGDGLPNLPRVEEEVRRIAELFPDRSRIFLGSEATEDRFRAERALTGTARHLHFAAHGYLSEDPEQMGIHLSLDPTRPGDGLLQAFEILGLDLHADLVVLSACETARGQRIPGEGILGLPRAFFYAGARSVVVSLWRADDNATAALMVAFYRFLSQGFDKAEALARAKLERIAAGDTPRLWAPFVLVGSPMR